MRSDVYVLDFLLTLVVLQTSYALSGIDDVYQIGVEDDQSASRLGSKANSNVLGAQQDNERWKSFIRREPNREFFRLRDFSASQAKLGAADNTYVDMSSVWRSPLTTATRPMLMSTLLQGRSNASAVFFLTTSRRDPFFHGDAYNVQTCMDRGRMSSYFGDGDFLPALSFEATYHDTTRPCEVLPRGNSPERVCDFHMTFLVRCSLGMPVPEDVAEVRLVRMASPINVDYGIQQIRRPPIIEKTRVGACAVLNWDVNHIINSPEQLEDWIAWHRMVGVTSFLLYGIVPPRLANRHSEPTFPEVTNIESPSMARLVARLLREGDTHYVELPARPPPKTSVAFHVMQAAQVNDCLQRFRDRVVAVKLGDLDEFLHPLSPDMDAAALGDRLERSGLPYLGLNGVRWRRSRLELPDAIAPGPLFPSDFDKSGFDAHEPHPSTAYSKTLVIPERVAFARIHQDHDINVNGHSQDTQTITMNTLSAEVSAINHHFGGGGPHKETEVKGDGLLFPFKPCLEIARTHPIDMGRVAICRAEAQATFLHRFGMNATRPI